MSREYRKKGTIPTVGKTAEEGIGRRRGDRGRWLVEKNCKVYREV